MYLIIITITNHKLYFAIKAAQNKQDIRQQS